VGLNASDCDQRHAEVTHPLEQSVERGLIGDRTAQDRGPVGFMTEGQTIEPGGPPRVEAPGHPDLVLTALGAIPGEAASFFHAPPLCVVVFDLQPAVPTGSKVGADVVSAHHHRW